MEPGSCESHAMGIGAERRWRHSRHNLTKTAARAPLDAALKRSVEATAEVVAGGYVESTGARYRNCVVPSPSASQSRRNDQNAIGSHSTVRLAELDASYDVLDAAVHRGCLIFISL